MSIATTRIEKQVKAFCAQIGADPLLVQGAGGNVSWKDGDALWVKASGTWLAHAAGKDEIFIPVDLLDLRAELKNGNFSAIPKVLNNSHLRPSIETMLHALMPQKIVFHLHAVEILSYLVRRNSIQSIRELVGVSMRWCHLSYFKPGAELAEAVAQVLLDGSNIEIIFLENHGVVVGADSISDLEVLLANLVRLFQNPLIKMDKIDIAIVPEIHFKLKQSYSLCSDVDLIQLATNINLSSRLDNEWALYPDHVVFLGEEAVILDGAMDSVDIGNSNPPFIFEIGVGVYESKLVTIAQKLQLRCYYDVLIRQPAKAKLVTLSSDAIAELLNWDAEKYRRLQF